MKYSDETLLSFVLVVMAEGYEAPAEMLATYEATARSKPASIRGSLGDVALHVTAFPYEKQVRIARALMAKKLPSVVDMMVYADRKEWAITRRRALRDVGDYYAAKELLSSADALTPKQRQKLDGMINEYEGRKRNDA